MTSRRDYEARREEAVRAFGEGRLPEAQRGFEEALACARSLGDAELADRAFCNLAAVRISRGAWDEPRIDLRRILTSSPSSANGFLAAYNLARAYELAHDAKKGLFYARIARDRAELLDDAEWQFAARHEIANLLTADSHFEEAQEEYDRALSLLPAERVDEQHEAWINVGYCDLMLGRRRAAITRLYDRLRRVRRQGLGRLEALVRQDLALALLEVERPDLAARHARKALDLSRRGEADVEKNCLFLLADALDQLGEPDDAFEQRVALQRGFYPDQPELPELLSQVNVRQLVNLRA